MGMIRLRQVRLWLLAGLLAAGSLRCDGGNVPPTVPTDIEMAGGDAQTGTVGQPLPNPLVVLVTDESGNPVPGVEVRWEAQGGGSVSAEIVKTGSNGRASVQRVLGTQLGQQTTTASATGLHGSPVTFVATATPGSAPASIVITSNPPVSALSGEVFDPSVQPAVEVKDENGNPASGVEVTASKASGSGTLDGKTSATTDGAGVAKFGDLGITGSGPHTLEFTAGTVSVTSSPVAVSPLPQEATTGAWGPVVNWGIVPLHMHLLPTGKILAWGKWELGTNTMAMPRLWDPSSGPPTGSRMVPVDTMLFCSGHTLMADGRIMVSGGHKTDDQGINVTNIFDPVSESWASGLPKMAHGRWYPTVTTLADGRVLTMAGRDEQGLVVKIPEIWENNRWVELTGASDVELPYYPRNFVAPDGRIFMAGERIMSRWFNVDGSGVGGARGSWTNGPSHIWPFNRDYGTAAMYDTGKILYAGGGGYTRWSTLDPKASAPTATTETIDLNQTSPSWQNTAGPMAFPRRHLNSTVLPDGEVLVTGGVSGGSFNLISSAVHAAEIWNPKTGRWTTLASNTVNRGYHAVSLLLPDATVLHGSSGDAAAPPNNPDAGSLYPPEHSHEIFSPPYLFKGARPAITSAPATVGYGQTFSVSTPNAAQVTDVRWIRLGSVTHAFDMSQRANTLTFSATGDGVDVIAPANANLAPPGYYLLFILNRNGVPSLGKVIKVQ